MAAELNHLSDHNLDISSLEALAKDISNRLKVNVRYGFEESPYVSAELVYPEAERRFDFYDDIANLVIGTVLYPDAESTATLIELDYLEKELCRKYGDTLPELFEYDENKFGPWSTFFFLNREPWYYLAGDNVNTPSAHIEKGGLSLGIGVFVDWHQFNTTVFEPDCGRGLEILNSYRKDIMRLTELCGGTMAYHIMGSRGFDAQATWAKTEKHIVDEAGHEFRDIVKVIERYHLNQEIPNISDPESEECFARVFMDDFRDLK